ncbi:MAG: HIT domain-containing protein [Candidatus Saccharimonadales bacterium]
MQPSLFTKIINGELPSYKIYEDELTYAFLNINPVQPGHVLVVPRQQVDKLEDLEDEDYEAVMRTVKLLMQHVRDELLTERVGLRVEGFEVPHAHVHIIPCDTEADLMSKPYEAGEDELVDMQTRLTY